MNIIERYKQNISNYNIDRKFFSVGDKIISYSTAINSLKVFISCQICLDCGYCKYEKECATVSGFGACKIYKTYKLFKYCFDKAEVLRFLIFEDDEVLKYYRDIGELIEFIIEKYYKNGNAPYPTYENYIHELDSSNKSIDGCNKCDNMSCIIKKF